MSKENFPLYSTPGVLSDSGWVFHSDADQIEIVNKKEEITAILNLANGRNSSDNIITELSSEGFDEKTLKSIINELGRLGILIDACEQYKKFHNMTKSSSRYNRNLTQEEINEITTKDVSKTKQGINYKFDSVITTIGNLSLQRESCRGFKEKPISGQNLTTILDASYLNRDKPVPSAGGLYPISIYVLLSRSSDLHPGIYQYDNKEGGFIGFDSDENSSSTLNTEELGYAMNSEDALYNAPAIIVISANIDRHPKKYANRGYRYTLLEVGHIAQNIHLSSLEIGLGSLEYGGFNDDKIAQILDFDKGEEALITIGVGHPESTKNKELKSLGLISKLEKKLIGKGKPIQSVLVDNHSNIVKELDFYRAISKYNPPNDGYNNTDELFAFGTAPSSEMAYIKAVAEAYERYKSGLVRFDVKDSAMNLDGDWLDPRIIKPLTDEQYSKLDGRLVKFNEELEIEWIKGHKKDGRSIYVPIDLVFYPLPKEIDYRRRVVTADSSGVAAYTDIEGATKNGLLELIERDATMRLWFNKIPPKRIDVKTLPDYYKKRAAYWKQKGRIVEFIDLSDNEKGIPIINVAIRAENDQYPFFVSGASANPNKKMALYKALCEAELGYSSVLNTEKIESIRPDEVESPIDHGKLYYTGTYADQIDWIWKGDFINWTEVCNTNNDKFIDKYDFIIVKLTQDMDPLQVVRVLCPELIPINFGYGNEHYSHSNNDSRVYDSSLPHFFA